VSRALPARLAGVDAARGVALLGMMAVHVFPGRDDDGATSAAHLLAAGRSAALFAVLAGVGVALATGGTRPLTGTPRTRWSVALVLRALLVGLVGLLLGELDAGVAVILAYYAVLFVVAVPLLGLGPRRLAGLALGVALLAPFLSSVLRADLPRGPAASPTLDTLVEDPVGLLRVLLVTGYYPVLGWTAYLCAGLAVGRLALAARRTAAALLGGGVALALAASAVSALLLGPLGGYDAIAAADGTDPDAVDRGRFGTVPTTTRWWLATDAPHSTTPPDLLHTTGTALAVLGLALLVAPLVPRLLAPLAAAGSLPLTLYCLHVGVLAAVRARGAEPEPLLLWGTQVLAALLLASLWRRYLGRGPLEALLALLTRAVTGSSAFRAGAART
jgi:uncharacterized membrane protein